MIKKIQKKVVKILWHIDPALVRKYQRFLDWEK